MSEKSAARADRRIEFDAEIESSDPVDGRFKGGAWVTIPFDVEEVYGTRGQVKVRATFDGVAYRGSLANMGTGGADAPCHMLGVTKAIRGRIGKEPGDTVHVTLERDTAPRQVTVPADLKAALAAAPAAAKHFAGLAFTYRKEYVEWIESAKRAETRERRLAQAVDKLGRGEKLR